MSYAIETEHLTRRFGRTEAVRDLTMQVPTGSVFALIGPNGAGKTTTIKTMMNLLEPTNGRVSVLGVDSRRINPALLARVGYVSENQELPEYLTIAGLMDYCKPFYPTWDPAFASELATQLDLPLETRLRHCSRGMKMKAALLVSLAYRPELLVMDEPFAGLDALVREEFAQGILEIAGERPWTVFISSHDIDEVERLADWIGIINKGRLELAEPVSSLLARFRQVEVAFAGATSVPPSLPSPWLLPQAAGPVLRFVDSAFSETESIATIRSLLLGATDIQVVPMPLRQIFITLARIYRLSS
ncbi:MAG: ABC transporter ATP-binding protein [Acidobacteriota bacterium]